MTLHYHGSIVDHTKISPCPMSIQSYGRMLQLIPYDVTDSHIRQEVRDVLIDGVENGFIGEGRIADWLSKRYMLSKSRVKIA